MIKSLTVLLTLAMTFVMKHANGQVNDENIRQKVLKKGIIDSAFIFW